MNKQKLIVTLIAIIFSWFNSHAQLWVYKPIPKLHIDDFASRVASYNEPDRNGAFYLENALPKNYDKTGKTDYTKIIQSAINSYSKVVFPGVPLLVGTEGLVLNNNQYLIFEEGSVLTMTPNNLEHYNIIYIQNVDNVTLFGPKIVGDRIGHKGKSGQWGAGIGIFGGKNVKIVNANISNCWGDGIYVTRSRVRNSSQVVIKNTRIDNTRRNGLSVISVSSLDIDNMLISNINGTEPQFALDIEPNSPLDEINGIKIKNLITFNNAAGGVLIALGKYASKNEKNIDVYIDNHLDDGSKVGFWYGEIAQKKGINALKKINGRVTLKNSRWNNNKTPYVIHVKSKLNPHLELSRPLILNPHNKAYTIKEMRRVLGKEQVIITE